MSGIADMLRYSSFQKFCSECGQPLGINCAEIKTYIAGYGHDHYFVCEKCVDKIFKRVKSRLNTIRDLKYTNR